MDMSVQKIYQTKIAEIQQRIPSNVKTNFSSVLNEVQVNSATENTEVAKTTTSSDDNSELLKSISQMMYTNTIMGGSSSLLSSFSSSGLSLPTYNTNTALSLALSKMMKSDE